jgi:hypothetical protein
VLVALGVAAALGTRLPADHGRPFTLVLAALVAAVYVLVLLVTRELTSADLSAIREVRGR